MSLSSPTGQRALDVGATPSSPLTEASLGRIGQVLTQAPLGTEKSPKVQLALIGDDTGSPELSALFYTQVYHWPPSAIVRVSGWDDVTRELRACSSIGELAILSHSVFDAIEIGGVQLTAKQFTDRFAPIAPPIGALSFDGCVFGTQLAGIHDLATTMKIDEVRGWTWWHYMDWWRATPSSNVPDSVTLFQPLAAIAAPWLPRSIDGRTVYTTSEQEALFAASNLNLFAEYFIAVLGDEAKPDFVSAVKGNTLDPNTHRPRSAAPVRRVDSSGAQAALEVELTPYPPLFARVVMTPWA